MSIDLSQFGAGIAAMRKKVVKMHGPVDGISIVPRAKKAVKENEDASAKVIPISSLKEKE